MINKAELIYLIPAAPTLAVSGQNACTTSDGVEVVAGASYGGSYTIDKILTRTSDSNSDGYLFGAPSITDKYITFIFPAAVRIGGFYIKPFRQDYNTTLAVMQYSNDGVNWTDLLQVDGTDATYEYLLDDYVLAKYVRFQSLATERNGGVGQIDILVDKTQISVPVETDPNWYDKFSLQLAERENDFYLSPKGEGSKVTSAGMFAQNDKFLRYSTIKAGTVNVVADDEYVLPITRENSTLDNYNNDTGILLGAGYYQIDVSLDQIGTPSAVFYLRGAHGYPMHRPILVDGSQNYPIKAPHVLNYTVYLDEGQHVSACLKCSNSDEIFTNVIDGQRILDLKITKISDKAPKRFIRSLPTERYGITPVDDVSATSTDGPYVASNLTTDTSAYWKSANPATIEIPIEIDVTFTGGFRPDAYILENRWGSTDASPPREWKILGQPVGSTDWEELDHQIDGLNTKPAESRLFKLDLNKDFEVFKMRIYSSYGNVPDLGMLNFIEDIPIRNERLDMVFLDTNTSSNYDFHGINQPGPRTDPLLSLTTGNNSVTFKVDHPFRIWRRGDTTTIGDGHVNILKHGSPSKTLNGASIMGTEDVNYRWDLSTEDLPAGVYTLSYSGKNRYDTSWYVEAVDETAQLFI